MVLMKAGLWSIVNDTEKAPEAETDTEVVAKYTAHRDSQGRQSRGSRGSSCSPKHISGGAALPQQLTGTILYIQDSQRVLFMLAVRN